MVLGRTNIAILGLLVSSALAGSNQKTPKKYQSGSSKSGSSSGTAVGSTGSATAPNTSSNLCVVHSFGELEACKRSTNIQIGDLQVPAGATLNFDKLIDGSTITITGRVTFGFKQWEGPLVSLDGNNIVLRGNGILDGGGERWWDGLGKNGKATVKPKFFFFHSSDSCTISGITIRNPPIHVFSIAVTNSVIDGITIDARDGNRVLSDGKTKIAHNTDAFDIGHSKYLTIKNSVIYNQDDCVTINSGDHITFINNECHDGHGVSVGTLRQFKDNSVTNVWIQGIKIHNSRNGLRIKTNTDASPGAISGVVWRDILLNAVTTYGIVIQQDYKNERPTGIPGSNVVIEQITAVNVQGTLTETATDVMVLCGKKCNDFKFAGIQFNGGKAGTIRGVEVDCHGMPSQYAALLAP